MESAWWMWLGVGGAIALFLALDFFVSAANAFSVLGMLALYFLLAALIVRFRCLRAALAAILVFVGVKMAGADLEVEERPTPTATEVIT